MGTIYAICLLCHSYKLMSAVVARRLMAKLKDHLPETQAVQAGAWLQRQCMCSEVVYQDGTPRGTAGCD